MTHERSQVGEEATEVSTDPQAAREDLYRLFEEALAKDNTKHYLSAKSRPTDLDKVLGFIYKSQKTRSHDLDPDMPAILAPRHTPAANAERLAL